MAVKPPLTPLNKACLVFLLEDFLDGLGRLDRNQLVNSRIKPGGALDTYVDEFLKVLV